MATRAFAAADRPATPTIGLLPAAGVSLSAFLLFALQLAGWGHGLLALSLLGAWLVSRELAKDLSLIGIGVAIVSPTSVKADVCWGRLLTIGTVLLLALTVPLLLDRLVYLPRAIRIPPPTGRRWSAHDKHYIAIVPRLVWLIVP